MDQYQKKALKMYSSAIGCAVVGVFSSAASMGLLAFFALYCSAFLCWGGHCENRRGIRFRQEAEWWRRAKNGVEQNPLSPCCLPFGKTGHLHDEGTCTRYRYARPKPITQEERLKIDEAWKGILVKLRDPEYGEEA